MKSGAYYRADLQEIVAPFCHDCADKTENRKAYSYWEPIPEETDERCCECGARIFICHD